MASRRKTPAQIAAEYGTEVPPIKPGQSEEAYFRQLAKRADQRLVRLEKLSGEKNYQGVLQYSYRKAMYDIKSLSGDRSATRFNIALKKNKDGSVNQAMLHAKINAVKAFLEAPTSMKKTITEMYEKRADTINSKYGTSFTWQDMGRFFESAAYDKLRAIGYGSDFILKNVGEMQKAVKPKKVEQSVQQNVRVPEDRVAGEVRDAMNAMQLTLKDFGL